MSKFLSCTDTSTTTADRTDGAVGISATHWFIAIVNNNSEKNCQEKLSKFGFECYVPVQTETQIRPNGRKKKIDRIVFPAMIFIRTTEKDRKEVVNLPFIKRFMVDRAGNTNKFNKHPIAIIPDSQINQLRFMLENADQPVDISPMSFNFGDRVRVVRGKLQGLEGHIARTPEGKSKIVISLECLGCASVEIDRCSLEAI